FFKKFFGDGSASDPANGFTRAGPASSLPIANAEFRLVSVIRVRWPELCRHLLVGLRPCIQVPNPHRDGRPKSLPFERSGKDFHLVGLLSWRDDFGLSWPATIQFGLNIFFSQANARRTSIYHYPHSAPVRFAPG